MLFMSISVNAENITTGDTVTVNFDLSKNLDVYPDAYQIWWHVEFTRYGNDPALALNNGDKFTVYWYDNNDLSTPIHNNKSPSIMPYDIYSYGMGYVGPAFPDNKGTLVFDDIVGDFEITNIYMHVVNSDGGYSENVIQEFIVNESAIDVILKVASNETVLIKQEPDIEPGTEPAAGGLSILALITLLGLISVARRK